jgi:hypothetical protein
VAAAGRDDVKWVLLALLVALLFSRKHLLGDLFRTVKKLPKDFDDGKQSVDDPASQAKPINPPKE